MPVAKRDENAITTLIGVSAVDTITPVNIYADPITHELYTRSRIAEVSDGLTIPIGNRFNTNNIDTTTTASTVYIGMADKDGAWYVKRINTSTLAFTHATVLNNPTVTTYSDAWAAIDTLTYGRYEEAF